MSVPEGECMVGYELKEQCSCNLENLGASVYQARQFSLLQIVTPKFQL